MKKLFLAGLVCCMTFICTGCVKLDYNIEISKGDRINISQTQAYNMKFFTALNPAFFEDGFKKSMATIADNYKGLKYRTKLYNDDDFSGLTVSKDGLTFKSAKEVLPAGFRREDDSFIVNKGFVKSSYKIHLFYDMNEALKSPDILAVQKDFSAGLPNAVLSRRRQTRFINNQLVDMTSIQEKYEAIEGKKPDIIPVSTLTIKIPAKATRDNADNVIKDKEYQWNLATQEQPVEIILEYETLDFSKLAAAVSLIVLLGAVLYLVQKVNKEDVVKGL